MTLSSESVDCWGTRKYGRSKTMEQMIAALVLLACLLPLRAEDWWSFRALQRPNLPAGVEDHPIDRFVRERLRAKNLKPAKAAQRRVLARRLAYDLWGVPLSTQRLEEFLSDDRPDAYERLVEELLASPKYGERWARHWLDAVHFGETHGYDKDQPRANAWRYRDYVIRSLNNDKAYSRFVREQIAGDVLWPETEDGVVALGFLAAGPWDLIGHMEVPESKVDGQIARHLDRDDMVTATMNVFCSLTVQCAQCHDHKSDPISMRDYYSLQSVFAALDRADREYDLDPEIRRQRSDLRQRLASAQSRLAKLGGEGLGYHSQVAQSQEEEKWVQVDLGEPIKITQIVLRGSREYGFDDFGFPHRFRVEVSNSERFTDSRVILDQTSEDVARPGGKSIDIDARQVEARYVRVRATKLWSRRKLGQPLSDDWIFALGGIQVFSEEELLPVMGVTAKDSIQAMPRWGKENLLTSDGFSKEKTEDEIAELREQIDRLPPVKTAYVATVHHGSGNFIGRGGSGGQPREIRILDRGDVTKPLELVGPGTIPGIVDPEGAFDLGVDHTEADRRVALANWIVDPKNTLTWRSIVNRVWQGHFGTGLVETSNDFGRLGDTPSHPELLDWLAVEFQEAGGSLKKLHRLIVTSETYKQASQGPLVNASIDGANRLLWRQNRKRLEAEAIRDTMLVAAGKMDWSMGGSSFRDFVIEKPEHSPHYLYEKADPYDPKTYRRSIYRFLVRSQPQPFMESLDCADPSLLIEKRGETTTSLQALAMMNSPFVMAMSEHFAKRIEKQKHPVEVAIADALGRRATHDEITSFNQYAKRHGLAAMCRVIFNLTEFSYVD